MKVFTKKTGFIISLIAMTTVGLLVSACSSPSQETPTVKTVASEKVEPVVPEQTSSEVAVEKTEPVLPEQTPSEVAVEKAEPVVPEQTAAAVPVRTEAQERSAMIKESLAGGTKEVILDVSEKAEILDPLAFAPKLRPYADSPYAKQIDTALMWMAANQNQHTCNWMDYAVLDYLQRKFGLDDGFAGEVLVDFSKTTPEEMAELALHGRVGRVGHDFAAAKIHLKKISLFAGYTPVEGEKYVTAAALEYLGVSIQGALLRAMYCDQVEVDDVFIDTLVRQAMETEFKGKPGSYGGYVITHMILAYQWLNELGCAEAFGQLAAVADGFAEQLVAIAEDQGLKNDLAMEAMAMLYYLGYADRIPQKWVDTVAAAQLEDGAWDRKGGAGSRVIRQGHTTAFGLWILLENAVPDAEDIPWLR